MKFTHVKKRYYATCLQWCEDNTAMIIELLDRAGCDATKYNGDLMLRWRNDWHKGNKIEMMKIGYVLRLGENDVLKIMSPEEFALKYEII